MSLKKNFMKKSRRFKQCLTIIGNRIDYSHIYIFFFPEKYFYIGFNTFLDHHIDIFYCNLLGKFFLWKWADQIFIIWVMIIHWCTLISLAGSSHQVRISKRNHSVTKSLIWKIITVASLKHMAFRLHFNYGEFYHSNLKEKYFFTLCTSLFFPKSHILTRSHQEVKNPSLRNKLVLNKMCLLSAYESVLLKTECEQLGTNLRADARGSAVK